MRRVFAFLLYFVASVAAAQNVDGAGASFPYPVYAKWATAYANATGTRINYQAIGSGGGIKQISAGTVDFGASDMPLSGERLDELGLIQFPMVVGGVVVAYNLPGIPSGTMKLSGPVLADIFTGDIRRWNDERIQALNPGLDLPRRNVTVVHRSDGSGTTFNFAHYLAKVSPKWADEVGVNTALSWPTGIGGKGNEGVANYIKQVPGAIGYVEFAHAQRSGLSVVQLQNKAGNFVEPSFESFSAAAEFAEWDTAPDFDLVITDQPGAQSWPLTASTFILMHKVAKREPQARAALEFFDWAYENGDEAAVELSYVPVPDSLADRVRRVWAASLAGANGNSLYSMANASP